jgi:hypothetical protein
MRQQEVNVRGIEFQQRLIVSDRIIADIDCAEQAAIALAEARGAEQG